MKHSHANLVSKVRGLVAVAIAFVLYQSSVYALRPMDSGDFSGSGGFGMVVLIVVGFFGVVYLITEYQQTVKEFLDWYLYISLGIVATVLILDFF